MKLKLWTLILSSLLSLSVWASAAFDVYFSPYQGQEAFEKIYETISNAREYAHLSIYSWSDGNIDASIEKALENGAKVRVVLHPPLAQSSSVKSKVEKLEALGAEFKVAMQKMHEKIILVDGETLLNTSANLSGGARQRYSENFIFHYRTEENEEINSLIDQFEREFVILWNSAKDIITAEEDVAERLFDNYNPKATNIENEPQDSDVTLYSSSMNMSFKTKNTPAQSAKGTYYKAERKIEDQTHTWRVRDMIIEEIDNAKESIFLCLNHFNIREVSDALIRAVKRGVNVKLNVDNQEFKTAPNNKEMTPQFVKDWVDMFGKTREIPVRVKYYSHSPSPRYWYLNHNKYIIVDYGTERETLISGSYNISKTAEQSQFDNMVVYRGSEYRELYDGYMDDFDRLWVFNRTANDEPVKEVYDRFFELKYGSYPLHIADGVALTWNEVKKLRSIMNKKAPGLFRGLFKKRDCTHYSPEKKTFFGCPK